MFLVDNTPIQFENFSASESGDKLIPRNKDLVIPKQDQPHMGRTVVLKGAPEARYTSASAFSLKLDLKLYSQLYL